MRHYGSKGEFLEQRLYNIKNNIIARAVKPLHTLHSAGEKEWNAAYNAVQEYVRKKPKSVIATPRAADMTYGDIVMSKEDVANNGLNFSTGFHVRRICDVTTKDPKLQKLLNKATAAYAKHRQYRRSLDEANNRVGAAVEKKVEEIQTLAYLGNSQQLLDALTAFEKFVPQ